MLLLSLFIFTLFFGFLNMVRGRGINFLTSKGIISILLGKLLFLLTKDIYMSCFLTVFFWAYSALGWGKYFLSFHGLLKVYFSEVEIKWLDRLVDSIQRVNTEGDARKWGVIAMSMRGLFFYPWFIFLSVYLISVTPALLGLFCAAKGIIYGVLRYTNKPSNYVQYAEFVTGLLFGLLTSLSLYYGGFYGVN